MPPLDASLLDLPGEPGNLSDASGGGGLQVLAQLSASLGSVAVELRRQCDRQQRLTQALRQLTVGPGVIPISGGAGTLSQDPMFGPNTGYFWSVRRLSAWGFTAGTVTVYLNQPGGEILPSFPAPGSNTFGRGEVMLQPLDTLIFVASGITLASGFGQVIVQGVADNGELWIQTDYLL
jgi:hypothetical protein